MIVKATFEWNNECGISVKELFPLTETAEGFFSKKNYGDSVTEIFIVLVCRPYDFKQRKRLSKEIKLFSYDIILDFFLIKHTETKKKKEEIIRNQVMEVSKKIFEKYKFEDFDTVQFLSDMKELFITKD